MKFLSAIIFALFFICAVQGQRGFGVNRRGPGAAQGGGAKSDCPTICPLNFQPTCGFNGRCYKEFSNSCGLSAASCSGEGKFRQVDIQECSKRGARIC